MTVEVGVSLVSVMRGEGGWGTYVEEEGDGVAGLELGRGEETGYELRASF